MLISTFQRFAKTSDTRPKTTSPISGKYCERSGLAEISLFTSASGPQTLEVTSSLNETWKPCPKRDPFPRCAARLLSPGATKLAPGEGIRTEKEAAGKNRVLSVGSPHEFVRRRTEVRPELFTSAKKMRRAFNLPWRIFSFAIGTRYAVAKLETFVCSWSSSPLTITRIISYFSYFSTS